MPDTVTLDKTTLHVETDLKVSSVTHVEINGHRYALTLVKASAASAPGVTTSATDKTANPTIATTPSGAASATITTATSASVVTPPDFKLNLETTADNCLYARLPPSKIEKKGPSVTFSV